MLKKIKNISFIIYLLIILIMVTAFFLINVINEELSGSLPSQFYILLILLVCLISIFIIKDIQKRRELKNLNKELQKSKEELEKKVTERTARFEKINTELQNEFLEKFRANKKAEEALLDKEKLLKEVKISEEKSKHSELILKKAQGIAQFGHWQWFKKTKELILSNMFSKVCQLPEDTDMNSFQDFFKFIYPPDLKIVKRYFIKIFRNKPVEIIQFRIINPVNSSILWLECPSSEFYETEDGMVLVGVIRNITQEKLNKLKLMNSEKNFKKLFDDSPVALSEFDFLQIKDQVPPDITKVSDLQKSV